MAESQTTQNDNSSNNSAGERGGELHVTDHHAEAPDKQNHGEQLEEISKLLRGGLDAESSTEDDNTNEGNLDQQTSAKLNKPPRTLQELSEATGIEIDELYKLAVPDGQEEGKTHTLGELKDAATKANALEVRELELEEKYAEREAKLTRQQTELQELFNLIPENFRTKELIEQVNSKHNAKVTREREKTLEQIPEWQDEAKRNEEIGGIVEHLQDYGLPPSYLSTVADHRLLRYIRENWKRHERVKKTLAMVNEKFPKPAGSKPTPPGKTESQTKQTGPRNTAKQVQKISNLLRNGA